MKLLTYVGMVVAGAIGTASACVVTDFEGLTAVLINPSSVTGNLNATGCDIGIYYNQGKGSVKNANIFGALEFGVVVNGDTRSVSVDVLSNSIHNIGDAPPNGNQRGVAIYFRSYFGGKASGRISGNLLKDYQKGGIVANGPGSNVDVTDNAVIGFGPVNFIAENGIQIGFGASAQVMRNTVSGHAYTGVSTVSGGIVVVGGPGYGICPDGPCKYTTGTQIVGNTVIGNDIGIFLSNLASDFGAPFTATNVKVINNVIINTALTNNYAGGYQAGVADVGNNDKIITNTISGAGYDPLANPSAYTVHIDADPSFTNRPKVHANR